MSDHKLAAIRALRLMLGALEESDVGSVDSIARVLFEVDRCPGCRTELMLLMLDMIVDPIACSARRDHWVAHVERELSALLDELAEP